MADLTAEREAEIREWAETDPMLVDLLAALDSERATEARLEIAALRGEKEGALSPAWHWTTRGGSRCWRLAPGNGVELHAFKDGWNLFAGGGNAAEVGKASGLRDGMRLAEQEARKRGWMQ